jgi:hypothetical protein
MIVRFFNNAAQNIQVIQCPIRWKPGKTEENHKIPHSELRVNPSQFRAGTPLK